MSKNIKLTIGLFGFGVVGEGLYKVLHNTPNLNASIKKVCIKHPEKKRNAPPELFTTNKDELLNDPSINLIVEVIDDADAAYAIIKTAFLNGKSVVSASKKMIAGHLQELIELQQETGRSFLYESAACASIPVIRNLEEYYDNDLLHSFKAIVNGSTNFILTKIAEENISFNDALKAAQEAGFAESDPSLDVEGYDALYKATILLTHAFGITTEPEKILFTGIQNLNPIDSVIAGSRNAEIKLIAQAKKLNNGQIAAIVLPQYVNKSSELAFVKNEFNGVVIESSFSDKQFFYGKGAGSYPTASALLSDISALGYDYRYEYKKKKLVQAELAGDYYLDITLSKEGFHDLPKDKFRKIDIIHQGKYGSYIKGRIHISQLQQSDWWKEDGYSLIAENDAIIETIA